MLKLGSGTGSLVNHITSRYRGKTPEVGMGVTFLHWTDRSPGTIISIDGEGGVGTIIGVQDDDYRRIDDRGFCENQDYEYTPNPNGRITYFRQDKNGKWQQIARNAQTGRWNKQGGNTIYVGDREKYHDFSF